MANKVSEYLKNANVQAFLRVIRYAEGTAGANGYRTMFTGKLFNNGYADHPRQTNCAGRLCSTAAGAYQFLSTTWDYLRLRLKLKDFSPLSQDMAAVELIREKKALDDIIAGRFESAIGKLNKTWASLPGSPYGQPVKTMAELKTQFKNYGGNTTESS
ncbi:MAG: glycoside hydrolase family 104 protein [Chitinophagales bacterium]|nr:glycoside hydrolase family 104 protein [Chitinophagales bacterium]